MSQEKHHSMVNANIEHGQEPEAHVTFDSRSISLATFLLGMTSGLSIGIFSTFDQCYVRKFGLSGSLAVLQVSEKIALVVAILAVVSKIQVGKTKIVEVMPRSSSAFVRAIAFAAVLTFLRGSLDFYVPDKIFEVEELAEIPI